jgi:hypothetical protein
VRVRGAAKVMCHLTFGVMGIAARQLFRMLERLLRLGLGWESDGPGLGFDLRAGSWRMRTGLGQGIPVAEAMRWLGWK